MKSYVDPETGMLILELEVPGVGVIRDAMSNTEARVAGGLGRLSSQLAEIKARMEADARTHAKEKASP